MLSVVLPALMQAVAPDGLSPDTAVIATKADYRQWPSAYDWYLATPEIVKSAGKPGRAVLVCKINDFGDLARCRVKEETPRGYGFGKAAMALRSKIKMVVPPKGQARWVLVPFRWDEQGPHLPPQLP